VARQQYIMGELVGNVLHVGESLLSHSPSLTTTVLALIPSTVEEENLSA